ncbi:MAG: NADPH-dependent F420 reductase [Candidatus Promineifilaceae bacterium]|jgi:predicted dinucleotide-binding enzyme
MKIGIIGAGMIGATLAKLFAESGQEVAISNSRGPETLTEVVAKIGYGLQAMSAEEAAEFGDLAVEAIPFGHYQELPAILLAEKILISASNYYPGRDGAIDLRGHAQTELIARHLPETRVVKAFNTIWYQHLATQGDTSLPLGQRRVIFLAGDDPEAKALVAGLIEEIGFGPLDTGSLEHSKVQEPGAAIYNVDMTLNEARALLKM